MKHFFLPLFVAPFACLWLFGGSSSSCRKPFLWNLKCPRPKQKIHNVPLVRLEPIEFGRRDRVDVQEVSQGRTTQHEPTITADARSKFPGRSAWPNSPKKRDAESLSVNEQEESRNRPIP